MLVPRNWPWLCPPSPLLLTSRLLHPGSCPTAGGGSGPPGLPHLTGSPPPPSLAPHWPAGAASMCSVRANRIPAHMYPGLGQLPFREVPHSGSFGCAEQNEDGSSEKVRTCSSYDLNPAALHTPYPCDPFPRVLDGRGEGRSPRGCTAGLRVPGGGDRHLSLPSCGGRRAFFSICTLSRKTPRGSRQQSAVVSVAGGSRQPGPLGRLHAIASSPSRHRHIPDVTLR